MLNLAKLSTVFNVADHFVAMNLSNGLLIAVFHIGNARTGVFQTMFLLYKEIPQRRKKLSWTCKQEEVMMLKKMLTPTVIL